MYDVDEVVDEKTVLNSSETGDLVVATAIYTTPPPLPWLIVRTYAHACQPLGRSTVLDQIVFLSIKRVVNSHARVSGRPVLS